MPKESESYNKKDTSTSEMIVITPNPRVEEVLVSDQDRIGHDALTYEARLNEKLKDLDLYEDDMTIQQKEELLEVVVNSWETAEKEKTRRQFFQDYMNASEAFCNDQYEFTLQESEEIHNALRCTDIPIPPEGSNSSTYSSSFQSSPVKVNGNFNLQHNAKDISSETALKMSSNEKVPIKSANELQSFDTRETKPKCRPPRRGRSRRGRGAASATSTVDTIKSSEATDEQPSLQKSISSWRPCLSPKETPLTCSKRPLPEEKDVCPSYSEEEYTKKVFDLVKEFDYARKEMQKSCPMRHTYSKPYHLTRRGLFVKKAGKPDKYDTMIGVTESNKSDSLLSETGFGPHSIMKGEPFSRTSEGAHRYIKSNRSESILSCTNTPIQITRSGTRYGFQRTETQVTPDDDKCQVPEREIITNSPSTDITSADTCSKQSNFPIAISPTPLNQEKDIFNELLPKFNHLRTSICDEVALISNGPFEKIKSQSKSSVSSKTKNSSSSASSESQNHIVNSSCIDSDSSDSSVIDVETVVDDEISEFVLKRKMLQTYSPTTEKGQSQSKRFKKGAS